MRISKPHSAPLLPATTYVVSARKTQGILLVIVSLATLYFWPFDFTNVGTPPSTPTHIAAALERCRLLGTQPGPPSHFHTPSRRKSDRFVEGTKPTLITVRLHVVIRNSFEITFGSQNATIWTGRQDGLEVIYGNILLQNGLIEQVGDVAHISEEYDHIDALGKWVSPG